MLQISSKISTIILLNNKMWECSVSLREMGINESDVQQALERLKAGIFGSNNTPSKTTYVLCPVDQTLWDLKPLVGILLDGIDQIFRPEYWVTTRYQSNLVNLGFTVIKFTARHNRELGIRGYSLDELLEDHVVIRPDRTEVVNGFKPIENVTNHQVSSKQRFLGSEPINTFT